MAKKRIFQITNEANIEDIDDKFYFWTDKDNPPENPSDPSYKLKADVLVKILNNYATKFVPNVQTVEGKLYWHSGELYICNTAYSGTWNPSNFARTTVDALVNELLSKIQSTNDSITEQFSTETDYTAGDFCYLGDTLKVCIIDHPAGQWVNAHFRTADINDVLKSYYEPKALPSEVATEADMTADAMMRIMTPAGEKQLAANLVAKASEQAALTTYAQNVAHSIAPEFVPNETNAVAGMPYMYGGKLYVAKEDYNGAWDSSKFEAKDLSAATFISLVGCEEFDVAVLDSAGRFLAGVCKDGSVEWAKGIPSPVKKKLYEEISKLNAVIATKVDKEAGKSLISENISNCLKIEQNNEYLFLLCDANNVMTFCIRADGVPDWQKGIPSPIAAVLSRKVDKEDGKGLLAEDVANTLSVVDYTEFLYSLEDKLGKLLIALRRDGVVSIPANVALMGGLELGKKAKDSILGIIPKNYDDVSDRTVRIEKPSCAVVNIRGIASLPLTGDDEYKAWMEFYDGRGTFFTKRILISAQGHSSLKFPKKNLKFDICNDEWIGDDTYKIAFGDWPMQDSYHLKAGWIDITRATSSIGYDYFDKIKESRDYNTRYPWMASIVGPDYPWTDQAFDNGLSLDNRMNIEAKCHPSSFPCVVMFNGGFYGIFCFQTKKHRDVYHQNKSNPLEIHLDGFMSPTTFFNGTIDWVTAAIEIRNPKNLIAMDGSALEEGGEPIDSSSSAYDPNNSKHVMTAGVKARIESLAGSITELNAIVSSDGIDSEAFDSKFKEYFDLDNLIDYIIYQEVTCNGDVYHNWQWNTWDGVRWFVSPYDLDRSFGCVEDGAIGVPISNRHVSEIAGENTPTYYVLNRLSYRQALEARYAELRQLGVIDAEYIMKLIYEFVGKVGYENYKKEFSKWDCGCNRDSEVSEKWELVRDGEGHPVKAQSVTWDKDTEYAVDDQVTYGYNVTSGIYTFRCLEANSNTPPISRFGLRDSIWRFECFMKQNIEGCDNIYSYQP